MLRAAPVLAIAALLAAPASALGGYERCCFRVETDVRGRVSIDFGSDPTALVNGGLELRWRWTVRQVARYGEKGRIFNALTDVEGSDGAVAPAIRVSMSETARLSMLDESGVRVPARPCQRRLKRSFRRSHGGFASLEDTLTGRIALVVRAGRHARVGSRCAPTPGLAVTTLTGPWAYELRPPAGKTLRRGERFIIRETFELRPKKLRNLRAFAHSRLNVRAKVAVRFTYIPRSELAAEIARLDRLQMKTR